VVDKSSITTYDTQRQAETKQLKADFDNKYLSCK
jgi:hypothetical protein